MKTDKINKLIGALQGCTSNLETYQNGKKIVVPFTQMQSQIGGVHSFFKLKNVQQGDKIGIIGSNCLEWVIIDLACIAAGVITVPFDPVNNYCTNKLLAEFKLDLILTNIDTYTNNPSVYSFENACDSQQVEDTALTVPVQYADNDVLTYKFTSGSTQRPKVIGAMKGSVDAAITNVQHIFRHNSDDKVMVFLPLHTYQQRYWIYSAILFDFNLLLVPKEYVFHSMVADKPTVIMGVPYFFETIMKNFLAEMDTCHPSSPAVMKETFRNELGGKIRYLWTGSAPLGIDTLSFYEEMGMPVFQGYGMNEICIVSKNYFGNNRMGSVGKLLPGKEVKFDAGNQILIKSDYPVNTCYYNATGEDNNATFLDDGYVATGDLGYLDTDGYLFINGRIKELIVLANAIKIHPAPVEKKVETSSLIKHCIVYGNNHPYLVALIVPAGTHATHQHIKDELTRINKSLQPNEHICNFLIAGEEFGEKDTRFSAQNKIFRNTIIRDYKTELDKLYTN